MQPLPWDDIFVFLGFSGGTTVSVRFEFFLILNRVSQFVCVVLWSFFRFFVPLYLETSRLVWQRLCRSGFEFRTSFFIFFRIYFDDFLFDSDSSLENRFFLFSFAFAFCL